MLLGSSSEVNKHVLYLLCARHCVGVTKKGGNLPSKGLILTGETS